MTTTSAAPTTSTAIPPPAPIRPRGRLLPADPVVRLLTWVTLVNSLGNGLFFTVSALYFTRILGYGLTQVGVVLTVAGLCGVLASIPAGRAADRWGSKRVAIALCAVEGVGATAYPLLHGLAAFVILSCAVTALDRGQATARSALYSEVLPSEQRVAGRAYLRAVTNVAMGLGGIVAGLTLQADTRFAYTVTVLADAASFLAVAVVMTRLPGRPPAVRAAAAARTRAERRNPALRDLPFIVITCLNAVLTLQFALLEIGVPLWIVRDTHAPRAMVAASMAINTVLVVLFQVRATRGTERPGTAARVCLRGGLLLAAGFVLVSLAHGLSPLLASVVLALGLIVEAGGEVLTQAGGWALSYDLAGDGAVGAYQGVFNAGAAAAMMVGPALVTLGVVGHGLLGWLCTGLLLAAAGAAMAPASRWAQRRATA
ncbi:MFS transporter [Kitasatospora sp. NBC_01287]|uniref:MFS transporter n=1 Tax=Kitasatospora sp. NBC_01287 TaxID=2903573 RepID=UPI00224E087E|nr:MFS transporter [Kitasatospora sp. NBC_01287]MCX4750690.1 MFS transporter [Kitasatospora sp. NBC_01287]